MAVYAALVSLMNLIENIQSHPRLSISLDSKQVESLGEKLDFLLNFVVSYNSHRRCKETEDLERQIVSAARKAEDVIESHIGDLILAGSTADGETSSRSKKKRIKKKIKKKAKAVKGSLQIATEAIDSIKKSIMVIELKGEFRDNLPGYSSTSRSLTSWNTTTVGFDEESIQLIERLIRPERDRQIIPIIGMGGTGKTTLARVVYEHSHIAQHFDIRMWATISQEYSVENILSQLLFGDKKNSSAEDVNELGEQLHKNLWGRRYLIILDDMRSLETWDEIQLFLPHNGNGDRIIITTRLSNMAAHLSSSPFAVSFLDEEKSWRLFCAKAFGEEDCPLELEEIGKNIVGKCKGLALAIVVMGGHLGKSSRMKGYWESVENDINSVLDSGEDQCLSILALSYNHMPAHLKPCFLYMGNFGEDEEIKAPRLSNLLVCEGLVKPNKGKSKEEIAEDYLEDLVDRNLILTGGRDYLGKYKFFKIHDILRELSIQVAKKGNFFCVVHSTTQTIEIGKKQHCVLIHKKIPEEKHDPEILQHEVVLKGRSLEHVLQQVNLRYLHCLLIPPTIGFLKLNRRPLYLPPLISLLWNLQTLMITTSHDKVVAPSEIWKMPQLRHLYVGKLCLPEPPHNNGLHLILQNLHTLAELKNFSLSGDVCRRIPNIKKLSLRYDKARSSYCPQNLGHFQKLESLHCVFSRPNLCRFARRLRFPASLQKLALLDCPLCWDDLTVIALLPHLVELKLFRLGFGPEWNPIELGFLCLESLSISGCQSLVSWNADSSHFPVLEYLHLRNASDLDEMPSGIGEIPTLRCISLLNCSMSVAISAARILVEQEELGNDGLRVEVWFGNKEEQGRFTEMVQRECLTSNNLKHSNTCLTSNLG